MFPLERLVTYKMINAAPNIFTSNVNTMVLCDSDSLITTSTAPVTQLFYGDPATSTTKLTTSSMPEASFVSDQFVKVQNDPIPLYQRMSNRDLTGAELHPLLKKVIDEANSLEKENKELESKLSASYNLIEEDTKLTLESQDKVKDLERKCNNQEYTIEELQTAHEDLQQAYDALKQVIRDYSEESVNEIVEDYKVQLASYEAALSTYENNSVIRNLDLYNIAELELRNAGADFAHRISPFVSKQWIRKNIFNLSDDEIKEIENQIPTGSEVFTSDQIEKIVSAFINDLMVVKDLTARDRILEGMNAPIVYTQDQVDKMIEDAKLDLLAEQDAAIPHEERLMEIGPGAKVWQVTTGRGPFWTQVLKPFTHNDKDKTKSFGWILRNNKSKEEHLPIGDLTDIQPTGSKPNKLLLTLAGLTSNVAMQVMAIQTFGPKAIIPTVIIQTILIAITYRELLKR